MVPFLIPLAASAAGLLACLALFLGLKRELHRELERLRREISELRQLAGSPRTPQEDCARLAPAPSSGLNVHKRVRILRMLRRGEDATRVAAVLSVPRSEVELLIRVQKLAGENAGAIAGSGGP